MRGIFLLLLVLESYARMGVGVPVSSVLLPQANVLCVYTLSSVIACLCPETGKVLWRLLDQPATPLSGYANTLVLGDHSAYHARTGARLSDEVPGVPSPGLVPGLEVDDLGRVSYNGWTRHEALTEVVDGEFLGDGDLLLLTSVGTVYSMRDGDYQWYTRPCEAPYPRVLALDQGPAVLCRTGPTWRLTYFNSSGVVSTIDTGVHQLHAVQVVAGLLVLDPPSIHEVRGNTVVGTGWSMQIPESQTVVAVESIKLSSTVWRVGSTLRGTKRMVLTPNLVALAATDLTSVYVYIYDSGTGKVLSHIHHQHASGPVHMVVFSNTVVYHYWSTLHNRFEISLVELYDEGQTRSTFVYPHAVTALGATRTTHGITEILVVAALADGSLHCFSPSRLSSPVVPTPGPSLLSKGGLVAQVSRILTSGTPLESTSAVAAIGLDLFMGTVTPSGAFDVLRADFNTPLMSVSVACMAVAVYLARAATTK